MTSLDAPVTTLRGVGPALAEKLQKVGANDVADLLFQLPLRYEDRTRVMPIGAAGHGKRCLIHGEILLAEVVYRGRRSLLVRVGDGTGQLTLRFFYFSNAQRNAFVRGHFVSCYGDLRQGPGGREMVHPEYTISKSNSAPVVEPGLTPVYTTTEGLQQGRMRRLVQQALEIMRETPPEELLPRIVREKRALPTLAEAIEFLHSPPPDEDLDSMAEGMHPCQRRLAIEELLAHHLSLRLLRQRIQSEAAPAIPPESASRDQFIDNLPFTLTNAQRRVLGDISGDMQHPQPMLRLVQGDVGSGKTVVAAGAAIGVIENGLQCALMAPTELLAEQHFRSFSAWLEPLGIRVAWLTGSLRAAARRQALAEIASGDAAMIIGTHALFQESVDFAALGLVIIDEQHRFGVHQRLALRDKGNEGSGVPHQLVMTATPIPRTLAMTAYADLDTSVIDELPPGRTPVSTVVIPESRREEVVARVREACSEGRQAYWVCPLVENSDVLDYQSAQDTAETLQAVLPELSVGLVHGRMKSAQKEAAMKAFGRGDTHVLVATTVIEVGVDVANASLMIIENAERMGLSQLHQLRGRVGRGSAKSSCVLLYKPPLSKTAKSRLAVLRDSNDGFVIAQRDLDLRGPGEVLGTRQTGNMNLRIADLGRDADLLPAVQTAANALLGDEAPAAGRRIDELIARWIGTASRYGNV